MRPTRRELLLAPLMLGLGARAARAANGTGPEYGAEGAASRVTPLYRVAAGSGLRGPLAQAKTVLVPFENTPFPYYGLIPKENKPFLDVTSGTRRGHSSARGGVLWADQTYSDRRVLVHIPAGFDPHRPAAFVVFFHGNGATLSRDVIARQEVPKQVSDSGMNAILLAPQFAYDAQDSSSGRYWDPGHFNAFLKEAGRRAAEVYGVPGLRADFDRMPVLLVAYSGGYQPAAYAAKQGGAKTRLHALILLDAVYAEEDKFCDWIAGKPKRAFFFSAFTQSSRPSNVALERMLADKKIAFRTKTTSGFAQGAVTFLDAGNDLSHDDFVTHAWVEQPIQWILSQVPGFSRKTA